jgi:hypothetical protein
MSSTQRFLLLAIALLLLGGLAVGTRWLLTSGDANAVEPRLPDRGVTVATPPEPEERRLEAPVVEERSTEGVATTVAYPLEVTLELTRPGTLPAVDGVPAWGTAGRARFKGFVFDEGNKGMRAELEFVYGANKGRILTCGADGAFGASDLHPGLSIVRIEGPGIVGSMREILLRQERETVLNVGYARPARVNGEVLDREGEPIEGARVMMDGLVTRTNSFGTFNFPRMASGTVLVVIEKDGYRSYRELLPVTAGSVYEIGRLRYALEPGASLELVVPEKLGGAEEAYVFLFSKGGVQRDYPWFLINPVRVWPGGRVQLDNLPSGRLDLRLFHTGALARPQLAVANLVPGSVTKSEIHLAPAPMLTGVVRAGGKPVAGAVVTLEAADRVKAVLNALGETYGILEGDVLPGLPPGVQTVRTNADGEYVLTSWEHSSKHRYLTAVGPGGGMFAGKLLKGDEERVDLALKAKEEDDAQLTLRMGGRFQGLPVVLRVRGEPREPFELAPDDDLVIGSLPDGTWDLSVRWNREMLVEDRVLELPADGAIDLALPLDAIEGQTGEIRRRTGRE